MPGSRLRVQFTAIRAKGKVIYPDRIRHKLQAYTDHWADTAITTLQKYPPPRASSRYVRTYTLQNAWRKRRDNAGGAIRVIIENAAQDPYGSYYARYVQGPQQTDIHYDGGWVTVGDIAARPDFARNVQQIIAQELT